jgi:hypothetical protein
MHFLREVCAQTTSFSFVVTVLCGFRPFRLKNCFGKYVFHYFGPFGLSSIPYFSIGLYSGASSGIFVGS